MGLQQQLFKMDERRRRLRSKLLSLSGLSSPWPVQRAGVGRANFHELRWTAIDVLKPAIRQEIDLRLRFDDVTWGDF
jgi:hypothetical protein